MNQKSGIKKYLTNTLWMVFGRLLKSILGFVVGILVVVVVTVFPLDPFCISLYIINPVTLNNTTAIAIFKNGFFLGNMYNIL